MNNDETSDACAVEELEALINDYGADSSMPTSGEFFYYYGLGNFRHAYKKQEKDWEGFNPQQTEFCERMFILANDFDSLLTSIHKIDWLTKQWLEERLPENDWAAYVQGDIHLFHAEMRSIFDSVARGVLIIAGNKSGQLNCDASQYSFNDLLEFCKKQEKRSAAIIGEELTAVIKNLNWFQDARFMRDSFVHFEKDIALGYASRSNSIAFRTVFGTTQRDIYRGPAQFTWPDGWIVLRPYMGYYLGRLWCFLNTVSKFAGARLELGKGGFSWVPPRLEPAIGCMKQAVAFLQDDQLLQ